MKLTKPIVALSAVIALFLVGRLTASGPIGVYGVIERVVFEPSEQAPERIQLWGAFAYAEGGTGLQVSPVRRGYLYFRLPEGAAPAAITTIKTEWADLKAVAGTGQAVGFGRWFYIAGFGALDPDARPVAPSGIYRMTGGNQVDLRVRAASEPPSAPAIYETQTGIVKLAADGSHKEIVAKLKDALRK